MLGESATQHRIDTKRSLRRTQAQNPNQSQGFDQCQTPVYALDPLFAYLPKDKIIWESAAGQGNLVTGLRDAGYSVIASDILTGQNFFKWQPERFDVMITNPPYSIKLLWCERAFQLGKPFALLLPVEILGVGGAQRLFERYGIEIILLDKRVNFQTINTSFEKSSAWFPVCWITSGLNIGQQITYSKLTKRPAAQLTLPMWRQ